MEQSLSRQSTNESHPRSPVLTGVAYLVVVLLTLLVPELSYTDADILSGRHATVSFINYTVLFLGVWLAVAALWVRSNLALKLSEKESVPQDWLYNSLFCVLPVLLLAAWCKPFLSGDTTYYVCYGIQIVDYGLNPYEVNLWASAKDPLISQLSGMWFENVAFYGPIALTFYSIPSLLLSEPGTLVSLAIVLKYLWLPFFLAFVWAAYNYWPAAEDRWARSLALAVNPILVWFALVDGHVDFVIALFLVCTAMFMRQEKPVLSALTLACAACFKIVGIVCLPLCFFWWFKRRLKSCLRFSATFTLFYGGLYALVKGGEYLAVIEFTNKWDNVAAGSAVPKAFELLGLPLASIRSCSNLFFYLCIALLCALLFRGKFQQNPALPMACGMFALFVTRTYFQPWYTLWFWPLIWVSSKNKYFGSVLICTVTLLTAWLVGWNWKGWYIGAVALASLVWVSLSSETDQPTQPSE